MGEKTEVKKNVSIYKGEKIYDKTILKMVGSETYCYLLNNSPELYEDFASYCQSKLSMHDGIVYSSKSGIDIDLVDANLNEKDVKKGLLAMIYENKTGIKQDVNQYVRNLKNSSLYEHRNGEMNKMDTFIFLIILIIIISLIIYAIYYFVTSINKDIIFYIL